VDPSQRKRNNAPLPDTEPTGERRRIGRVVHDDRGNGRVEWDDAPPDFERPKLEVEDPDTAVRRLAILNEGKADPFDPYSRGASARKAPPPPPKRDLRKLSEWIKMMRQMEERKERGEDEEESP
jgi:hypothetical protein